MRGLSWAECEALCGEMTAMRAGIREERGIKPPIMFCRNCQAYHEMKNLDVSVRALLSALKKVGAVDESKLASQDKTWQQEQKKRKREMAAHALASAPTGEAAQLRSWMLRLRAILWQLLGTVESLLTMVLSLLASIESLLTMVLSLLASIESLLALVLPLRTPVLGLRTPVLGLRTPVLELRTPVLELLTWV